MYFRTSSRTQKSWKMRKISQSPYSDFFFLLTNIYKMFYRHLVKIYIYIYIYMQKVVIIPKYKTAEHWEHLKKMPSSRHKQTLRFCCRCLLSEMRRDGVLLYFTLTVKLRSFLNCIEDWLICAHKTVKICIKSSF